MQATDWDGASKTTAYTSNALNQYTGLLSSEDAGLLLPYESGQILLSNTIDGGVSATIAFQKSYSNPVIVAYIVTRNGGESVDVRVAQVTESGCMLFLEEPDDEGHAPELVGYLVMEAGAYSLEDGTQVEAGTVTTASVHREWDAFDGESVAFSQAFSVPPVLLHTLKTYQNGEFMSSVSPSVSAAGFTIQQEAAGSGAFSASETIDWIAIEAGKSGTLGGRRYESGRRQAGGNDGADDSAQLLSYSASFSQTPIVLVDGYAVNGGDGCWARASGTHTATAHGVVRRGRSG